MLKNFWLCFFVDTVYVNKHL